jgi:RNA polymerase sigma-70 factor (ECF subfamily)
MNGEIEIDIMADEIDQWAEKSRNGDRIAFGKLYDRFMSPIYRFVYYRVYNKGLAEDLTSQTFLKAVENIASYDRKKGKFSSWLYRIARNLVIDYYRSRKKTVELDETWDIPSDIDIEDDVHRKDMAERLKSLMRILSGEQREIVVMRLWQELPYNEIAGILGKTEAGCKMMFSRAIAKLRDEADFLAVVILFLVTGMTG